jgi:hypothetical protein
MRRCRWRQPLSETVPDFLPDREYAAKNYFVPVGIAGRQTSIRTIHD